MTTVMTYKSGKFTFSLEFDKSQVQVLLVKAMILNETIRGLPVLPQLASSLDVDLIASSVAGTVAIEGNPLTEADVKTLIKNKDIKTASSRHKQEIKNIIEAYAYLKKLKPSKPFLLDEAFIKQIHSIVTKDIEYKNNLPGGYRNGPVEVGDKKHGGIYRPPKILDDIKQLMEAFITWINSDEILQLGPFVRAPLAHYYFSAIHPFWDGNGRTARLIESAILQAGNIRFLPKMLSNYYYKNVDDYYCAFSDTEHNKNDVTPFLLFYLKGAVESLTEIKDGIVYFIRKFAIRDFLHFLKNNKVITTRQFDLLCFLLEAENGVTIDELFTVTPYSAIYRNVSKQTAKRDIHKLVDHDLVTVDDDHRIEINFECLDDQEPD